MIVPIVFVALVAIGCGSSTPSPTNGDDVTAVPRVEEGAQAADPVVAPSSPRNAAITIAMPMAALDAFLVGVLPSVPPYVAQGLEEILGPGGSRILSAPSPLSMLGIDVTGTAILMVAPVDPAQEGVLQAMRDVARSTTTESVAALSAAHERLGHAALQLRIIVPVAEPVTLIRFVRVAAREARLAREMERPEGADLAWTVNDALAFSLHPDAGSLTADVWMPLGPPVGDAFPAQAAPALARARADVLVPDPAATTNGDAETSRMAVDPVAAAKVGALYGEALVQLAVTNVNPDARLELVGQGIREACNPLDLTAGDGGPYVQSILAKARGGAGGVRAEATSTRGPASAETLAPATTRSLDLSAYPMVGDVSVAWARGYRFANGASGDDVRRQVEYAGAWGWIVTLGHSAAIAALQAFSEIADELKADQLERMGVYATQPEWETDDMVLFGIMPEGATPARAACLLPDRGAPCTPRLVLNRTIQRERSFARLARIDGRLVVLVTPRRENLDRLPTRLTGPLPVARLEVESAVLANEAQVFGAMAPGRTIVEVLLDGGALRSSVRSTTAAHP